MLIYITAIIVGLCYASLLYVANKRLHYGIFLTTIMFSLRAITASFVTLLLFNPYIKQKNDKTEQATIVVAQDNSLSLILNKDSSFYKKRYPIILDSIVNIIDNNFIVDKYLFGNTTKDFDTIDYQDHYTDISDILSTVKKSYYKKNVGAVILLSDGICNKSYPPEQNIDTYPFPIYTVTLGDTTNHPDLFIKDVRYNKTCHANTTFPIQVIANAVSCKNKSMEVDVFLDNELIQDTTISINTDNFSKTLDFDIYSEDEGTKQIDVRIKTFDNETQTKNNDRRFFVEVVDKQYKTLCIAKSPHPDIASINNVLGEHFDLDIIYFNYDIPEFNNYDIVIMYQVPFANMNNYTFIRQQLEKNDRTPILYIVGNDTDIESLNNMQSAVQFRQGAVNSSLDIKPYYNKSFGLFSIDKETAASVNKYPPLSVPHLETTFNSNHDILLKMNIMNLTSETPMLCFSIDNEKRKTAYLIGTGIWRWKLYDYYHKKNFDSFSEILNKTAQYLITEKNKELNIYHKDSYLRNEAIVMTAEMRNPSHELTNDAELKIRITDKHSNDTFEYIFSKNEKNYTLNINTLPEGIYTYIAETDYGNTHYKTSGTFSVVDVGAEATNLTADAQRLKLLSTLTEGCNFSIDNIDQLIPTLNNDERLRSVTREDNNYIDLINLKSLFFLILTMISIEWSLRKFFN